MKITKRGEYALRVLLALASVYDEGRTLNLREISEEEKLPVKFLEQIMIILKKAGLVQSTQGQHGGYALSISPKEMTLGKIIRTIEGPLAPIGTRAEIEKRIQQSGRAAGLYFALLEVRDAVSKILDKKTLADVYEKSLELAQSKPQHQMYYI